MKVYDCFTFYNEFELLELRLKALWNVVDVFVLVEADKTHNNKPKPFYFWERQDEFKDFFPKIRHLPIEMNVPYSGVGDWSIENAQRDAIAYGLEDAAPDDLIMVSDVDEIPNPEVLRNLNEIKLTTPEIVMTLRKQDDPDKQVTCPVQMIVPASDILEINSIRLKQTMHYYFFDWVSPKPWLFGTTLAKRKNLTTPQKLRMSREALRYDDGGYHFSYMGGIDNVLNKMTAIVDGNKLVVKSGGKLLDRAHVEQSMATGTDVYERKNKAAVSFEPFDARNIRLPHIDEFLRKYPHFLREPEKYFAN